MIGCRVVRFVAVAVFALGCSAGGNSRNLLVGNDGTGGASGGSLGGGGSAISVNDASVAKALSAHIESPPGMTVTFVTLSCSARCADVRAVATGGFPPYSFKWEDGSMGPNRHVCPSADTSYEVFVTDTGSNAGEFTQAPQTKSVPLSANVIRCNPDGGSGSGASSDGGLLACQSTASPVFCGTTADMTIDLPAPMARGASYGIHITGNDAFIPAGYWDAEIWGTTDGCTPTEKFGAFREQSGAPLDVWICARPTEPFAKLVYHNVDETAAKFFIESYGICGGCPAGM
jgi:hypothetical protein